MDIESKIKEFGKRDLKPELFELFEQNNLFQYIVEMLDKKHKITFHLVNKYWRKVIFKSIRPSNPIFSDKQKLFTSETAIQMSRFLSKNWGSKFLSSDILLS